MWAECQFHLGQRDAAVAMAQEVLDQDTHNLAALVLLSDVAMVDRDYSRAVELLRRAVADNPFDYVAHHKLSQALTHEEAGAEEARQLAARAEELKAAWQRFSQLNKDAMQKPYDVAVRRELAEQAESLGRADLAQVWRQAAETLEKTGPPETKDEPDTQ
jgi:tetratricopeptide (TPR) repeat protein